MNRPGEHESTRTDPTSPSTAIGCMGEEKCPSSQCPLLPVADDRTGPWGHKVERAGPTPLIAAHGRWGIIPPLGSWYPWEVYPFRNNNRERVHGGGSWGVTRKRGRRGNCTLDAKFKKKKFQNMSLESWLRDRISPGQWYHRLLITTQGGRSLRVRDKPGSQRDFYDSQCYTEKLCLKKHSK